MKLFHLQQQIILFFKKKPAEIGCSIQKKGVNLPVENK